MADKPKDKKIEKKHHSSGGLSFGMEVILFVVAIFIIWILAGGAKKEAPKSPLLVPASTNQVQTGTNR